MQVSCDVVRTRPTTLRRATQLLAKIFAIFRRPPMFQDLFTFIFHNLYASGNCFVWGKSGSSVEHFCVNFLTKLELSVNLFALPRQNMA